MSPISLSLPPPCSFSFVVALFVWICAIGVCASDLLFYWHTCIHGIDINITRALVQVVISSEPSLVNAICRSFVWYHWDPLRGCLSYISRSLGVKSSAPVSTSSALSPQEGVPTPCVFHRLYAGDAMQPIEFQMTVRIWGSAMGMHCTRGSYCVFRVL